MTPSALPIDCESRIERVVVYARGAVVTRRVTLPEALPEGPIDLRVAGVTARAEAGSVRAVAGGDREVTALRARVVVPAAPAPPGALVEKVRALKLEQQRIAAELVNLEERRGALAGTAVDPGLRRWARNLDPAARFGDALAVSALVDAEIARIDGLARAALAARDENRRAIKAAEIAAAQGTTEELAGEGAARLDVLVRLGAGGGEPGALAIEYVVRAARWWPAYTARFTAAATRVALTLDALVAQASGEDWSAVALALSTADLAQDARLPELRSLRFGRSQPAPKRGYRAPPLGLDALFEGYDRAGIVHAEGDVIETLTVAFDDVEEVTRGAPPGRAGTVAPRGGAGIEEKKIGGPARYGGVKGQATDEGRAALPKALAQKMEVVAAMEMPASLSASAPPAQRKSVGLRSRLAPSATGSASHGGFDLEEDEGGGDGAPPAPEPIQAIEPGEAWLDFDTLTLGDPRDRAHRGRLVRDAGTSAPQGADVEGLDGPPLTRDPQTARGRFDHRYDAEGTADVTSSGRPHRIAVTAAEGSSTPRFIAVPREVAEVFREAEIQNPFGAPLLSGPVDVFLDGALVTTAQLAFVDRAGWIRLGLGVEERLRVARNARVEEHTAGLLGGSAVIDHAVTIDLASSLGHKVTVEVLERVPVTDEKDVEIKTTYARPEPERVALAERGAPLRRGLRFQIDVPAGDKAKIELGYRVTLPAKNEIVGGNRRE